MIRTHVLIVGGGPAGSTAARFLARQGIETILVERDFSYVKPCGGGIPSATINELDIPRSVIRKEVRKIRIVSPKGEKIDIALTGGHLCITERGILDSTLREMARVEGALTLEGEFSHFETRGKSIVSVVREKLTHRDLKIQSRFVVASDGITNRIGTVLRLPKLQSFYTISARMTPSSLPSALRMSKPDGGDRCEFWFGAEHASHCYSWVFPSGEYSSIGTGAVHPGELPLLLEKFLKRRSRDPGTSLQQDSVISNRRIFKVPINNGSVSTERNILFTGDAAGTVLPITYEGIYYAMKSGEFAARAITEGKPHLYKRLWNGRFRRRFLLMNTIRHSFFKSDEHIEKWLSMHKRPEVQEIAMRLLLRKESGSRSLISYLNFFRHLLRT